MATLRDRMPVIFEESDWPKWLGKDSVSDGKIWPVGKAVGNVRNDGPELAETLATLV